MNVTKNVTSKRLYDLDLPLVGNLSAWVEVNLRTTQITYGEKESVAKAVVASVECGGKSIEGPVITLDECKHNVDLAIAKSIEAWLDNTHTKGVSGDKLRVSLWNEAYDAYDRYAEEYGDE